MNVLFFRYFEDDGREYAARTWLIDERTTRPGEGAGKKAGGGSKEVWNGQDWYVSFGEAMPFDAAVLPRSADETVKMTSLPLKGTYRHSAVGHDDDDTEEYVVPVRRARTVARGKAVWERGMFANQNSACKLRNRFTLDELAKHFDLDEE